MDGIKATLTRKVGGVPTFVYVGVGVAALAFILVRRKNQKLAAEAASQAGGDSAVGSTTSSQVPGGMQGQLSGMPWQYGDIYANYNPPQQPSTMDTSPDYPANTYQGIPLTPISGEKIMGGGYSDPTGYFWKPIVSSQGVFQYTDNLNASSKILQTLIAAGETVFVQTSPGVFTPVDSSKVPSGTPVYQRLPGVPYSPTTVANPAASAASGGSPTAAMSSVSPTIANILANRVFYPGGNPRFPVGAVA